MNAKIPQGIPPALAQQIQAALAEGRPLPPGVIAVPDGQRPPPGAIPAGITAQMPPGMPQQMAPSKVQHNPIPDGEEGLKILRGFANCQVPSEASKLNRMLQMLIQTTEPENESLDVLLAKGLAAAMKANRSCALNKKSRTVCIFAEDEKLTALHAKIQEEQTILERLNNELEECVNRANTLLVERWNKAVDAYGLNPEKYLYHIDEERGIIEQVDLECDKCKGLAAVKDVRTEITNRMMVPAPGKETPEHDN